MIKKKISSGEKELLVAIKRAADSSVLSRELTGIIRDNGGEPVSFSDEEASLMRHYLYARIALLTIYVDQFDGKSLLNDDIDSFSKDGVLTETMHNCAEYVAVFCSSFDISTLVSFSSFIDEVADSKKRFSDLLVAFVSFMEKYAK